MLSARIRLRSILVLIVIFGVVLGMLRQRSKYYTQRADYHDSLIFSGNEVSTQGIIHHTNRNGISIFEEQLLLLHDGTNQGMIEASRRMNNYRTRIDANQDWHQEMKSKFLQAASRPWLMVDDSQEPSLPSAP